MIITQKAGDRTKRGEVHWTDLRGCEGHEEGKRRPVLIIQNDKGNMNSQTTIVAPITTHSREFITHVYCQEQSLDYRSQVLLEQIRTIDKSRVGNYICALNSEVMAEVDEKIKISLALNNEERKAGTMEGLRVFNNDALGLKVRTILNEDGSISVNAEDTAIGFGWYQNQNKNGKEYISIRWERMNSFSEECGFPHKWGKDDYIPESLFYRLGMKANNAVADKFQNWLAMDVIPSIRKTGSYQYKKMTPEEMMRVQLGMIDGHEERISRLENTMNIDYGQQRVLEKGVASVVIEALGGKDSNAYREIGKKVFAECNRDVKDYFHVNSRNNIPRVRFDDAVEYINNWTPCRNTVIEIQEYNAQITL